jgi:hypothetical protein
MRRIKFGAEFQLRYTPGIEFNCNRIRMRQHSRAWWMTASYDRSFGNASR